MKTVFIALRATLFSTGFIFLWGWVALSLHRRYDTSLGFAFSGWTPALGIALMAAGGTLAFVCIATFVSRGEGTPAPQSRRAAARIFRGTLNMMRATDPNHYNAVS